MRRTAIAHLGRPVNRYNIAPDRAELHETAQNPTGPHGVGRPRMNLHQCANCLAWSPLAFLACPRCKAPIR